MDTNIEHELNIRSSKRKLYIALLEKGPIALTKKEHDLLVHLMKDEDIVRMIINGSIFDLHRRKNKK